MSRADARTDTVVLPAPAKLNLHLGIYPGLDEQGYHRADSLMVALDVADEVEVQRLPLGAGLHVQCEPPIDLAPEKNTAYRAALALARAAGIPSLADGMPDVQILLRKCVPSQAGLGGASSDAASVLLALCDLWGIEADEPLVAEVARSVGADVAFFLDPVPTLLVGRGDVVAEKFAPLSRSVPVVLVRPAGEGVSTPVAYRAFDEEHEDPGDVAGLCAVLREANVADAENMPARIAALLFNNLDPVACRLQPVVREVRDWLRAQSAVLGAQVSGSGSCVFGICATNDDAQRVALEAATHFGPDAWTRVASFR